MSEKNKLNGKDLINIGIFTALYFILRQHRTMPPINSHKSS